jgi:adenylate cyclase
MSLLRELQRRNVGRVATAYVVASWLIVQVADTVLLNVDVPERIFQIVVIALAIGFVPAVIMAWLFEWTPDGLKRDEEAEQSPEFRLARARRLDRGIIVVLLLAVSYFAVDKFVLTEAEFDDGFYGSRSIAVMPFEVNSADPEQQFFANGVVDEIHFLLGTIRDLRVIAQRSATRFHEDNVGIAEIRDDYKVGHLLEGSVRIVGNKVRLTARLIETSTETQLWTEIYERDLEDVFEIQNDIAANVVHGLKVEFADEMAEARQTDPEVVALVQQAKMIFQVRDGDVGKRMTPLLERALELDPDYIPAIEWLNNAMWLQSREGTYSAEEFQQFDRATRERLLELDPQSAYVTFSEGWDYWEAGNWERASDAYLRGLARDLTDSSQVRTAAMLARSMGKLDIAIKLLEHAMAVDPYCFQCIRVYSQVLLFHGDYNRAIAERERYLKLAKGGYYDLSMMLILAGRPGEVGDLWASSSDRSDHEVMSRAMAAHTTGDSVAAQRYLQELEERYASTGDEYTQNNLAQVHAWLGNKDRAFQILMPRARDSGFDDSRLHLFHPVWRELRDDPRWQDYRAALGMSQARLDAIEFDPWLPE